MLEIRRATHLKQICLSGSQHKNSCISLRLNFRRKRKISQQFFIAEKVSKVLVIGFFNGDPAIVGLLLVFHFKSRQVRGKFPFPV
jgi:hypothetical protein